MKKETWKPERDWITTSAREHFCCKCKYFRIAKKNLAHCIHRETRDGNCFATMNKESATTPNSCELYKKAPERKPITTNKKCKDCAHLCDDPIKYAKFCIIKTKIIHISDIEKNIRCGGYKKK